MQKQIKNWLTGGLGTTLIGFILSVCWDLIKDKPILSTLLSFINWFYDQVLFVLNFELKVWWVLLAAVTLLIIVVAISQARVSLPEFYNYNKDIFHSWTWRWEWELKANANSWRVSRLTPYCPSCDSQILPKPIFGKGTFAECSRCKRFFNDNQIEDSVAIESIIIDNIRKKNYQADPVVS